MEQETNAGIGTRMWGSLAALMRKDESAEKEKLRSDLQEYLESIMHLASKENVGWLMQVISEGAEDINRAKEPKYLLSCLVGQSHIPTDIVNTLEVIRGLKGGSKEDIKQELDKLTRKAYPDVKNVIGIRRG